MIADIQESRVEPGQNRLARTSGIRPEADISLECLKMSANDPKRPSAYVCEFQDWNAAAETFDEKVTDKQRSSSKPAVMRIKGWE